MAAAQFVDISAWQPLTIDWQAYKAWAAATDGSARIALRSSYGTGYRDAHYQTYRAAAEAAGIQQIIHYHYAYPQDNTPEAEADSQHSIVGSIGPNDLLMLDFEEDVPEATADWAYRWLSRQEANYGGRLPIIYASESFLDILT
jgi:GH25 family lysozyme M1 (1,4-beta-N-acetylmuramidase)